VIILFRFVVSNILLSIGQVDDIWSLMNFLMPDYLGLHLLKD